MSEVSLDVMVQIRGVDLLAGRLFAHRRPSGETATFTYDEDYLARPDAYELDPQLALQSGAQHTRVGQSLFGAIADCAPDRWGRLLIERLGRQEFQRANRNGDCWFGEVDYLIGVGDYLRQGALRFRYPKGREFLAHGASSIPPIVELSKLMHAAERLELEREDDDDLQLLLRGGSSLGGARPKAHVLIEPDRFGIAKFPSARDTWDVIAWEAVALDLARSAGINVSSHQLHRLDDKPVLIVERFDRNPIDRIGYVSAMTMLEAEDGTRASYLEIGAVIETVSPWPTDDLRELWRRIAFSILISNTDDHLRNHGFLRGGADGWSLSPAFDMNPEPRRGTTQFATAIDLDPVSSLEMLMDVSQSFRLSREQSVKVIKEVHAATSKWRNVAKRFGITPTGMRQMETAFEHSQMQVAVSLV